MALPEDRQNRTEMFLGAIAGDGSTPPEDAQTRLERYLAYFAGSAESKPDAPHTRLERFLDAIDPGTPSPILPEEYREVEWLQSNGTGYINTKHVITPNSKIEMDFDASTYTGFSVLLGAEHGNPNIYSGLSIGSTNINLMSGTGSGSNAVGVAYEAASMNKIMVDGIELTVNESSASIPTPGLYPSEPAYFLARNSYGPAHNITTVKVHSLKIEGVKWFLCYRISDGVIGLYNPTKAEFLPGSGTIAKGPDVVSANEFLEAMEGIL